MVPILPRFNLGESAFIAGDERWRADDLALRG
jgi:hypothetical protein